MIDLFTLALTHGLIALALWRMLFRADLDLEGDEPRRARTPGRKTAPTGVEQGPGDA